MQNITDEELLDFLDGKSSTGDRARIENTMAVNSSVKKRIEELQAVHLFLQTQNTLVHPSKKFTNKVMENLHRQSAAILSPKNGMLLLLGILVASGLALALVSTGTFDHWQGTLPFDASSLKNKWIDVPSSLPFDIKVFVKGIVLLNAVLALLLLDRTILRPFFQNRRLSR